MRRKTIPNTIHTRAQELVRDPQFLYLAAEKIKELGVVGETRNGLILFLAALTKDMNPPVSVLVKGSSSSGKSNLAKSVIRLLPPEIIVARTSLSGKAPAHTDSNLTGKILYIAEYRGAKEAQYLLRLQQSEAEIIHEYATLSGRYRSTQVAKRVGSPVILTTTTDDRVFEDDETRFLSVWMCESAEQTLAILKAQSRERSAGDEADLRVWHQAVRLICAQRIQFRHPSWLEFAAALLPTQHVRVRRDWPRFITFCKAIALCRRFATGDDKSKVLDIEFADYCVAHRILNTAMASSTYGVHENAIVLARAVKKLARQLCRAVTLREVADHLGWGYAQAHKYANRAVTHKLVRYEEGTREKNVKPLLPVPGESTGFLPSPWAVLHRNEEIDSGVEYSDPLTGKMEVQER